MTGISTITAYRGVDRQLRIEVLEKSEDSLGLFIEGTDVSFMNALRRTVISEVPSMAIDETVIIENSSVVHDEALALRLGLIPMKTDLKGYNLPEDCSCKSEFGCNLCRVSFTLDIEAKGETTTAYSGELISEDPNVAPVSREIPIVKLSKGQRIRLEAYARLGKGKDHAKWQPVSSCTYKHYPAIRVSSECDGCGDCVQICPRRVLAKSGDGIAIRDLAACTLCKDCVEACPKKTKAIEVGWKEDTFIFRVESTGAIPPKSILEKAVKILNAELKEFIKQAKVKKTEKK